MTSISSVEFTIRCPNNVRSWCVIACLQLQLGSIHSHDALTPSHLELRGTTLSHCVGHNRTSLSAFSFESAAEFLVMLGFK